MSGIGAKSRSKLTHMATNNVTLAGNITRDPEKRYTPKGSAVTTFGLAVNEKTGETEKSNFFDVNCWGSLAEGVAELKKGQSVIVVGALDYQTWDDKQSGQKRSAVKVKAWDVGLSIYAKAHAELKGDRPAPQRQTARPQSKSETTPKTDKEKDEDKDDMPF